MTTHPSPIQSPRFLALSLEPRIMFDAAAAQTVEAVTVAATADAPGVTATPAAPTVHIDDNAVGGQVDLFSDVSVQTDNGGQALADLVITVDRSGGNQALVIDGTEIALENGGGETAGNFYGYTVSVSGGATTITISIESSETGHAAGGATALIDSIAYKALDKTVESGAVTITLKSLSDEGGQNADLGIEAAVTVDNQINVAPVLGSDGGLEPRESFSIDNLGHATEITYSSDGKYAYAAGTNGIQVFSIDDQDRLTTLQTYSNADIGTVSHMVISTDGKSIYTISGSGTIVHLSVGEDGKIGTAATVETQNGNATGGLAISEDGKYVYVGTQYNDVAIFSRDLATGALTILDNRAPGDGGSSTRNGVVATSGDYVYVAYGHFTRLLFVYQRNADGTLSTAASYTFSTSGGGAVDYGLAVSADGQYVYLADPEKGTVSVYRFSGDQLTPVETLTQGGVSGIALGGDGNVLYAASSNGVVTVYTVAANGTLSLAGSISTGGSDIAVSGDGLSILVAGSGGTVSRYSLAQALNQGSTTTFADGLTLKDGNYDVLGGGAGNYKGASITVSADVPGGSFGFADGSGLTYAGGVISLDDVAIATLSTSGGVLTVTFTADTTKAVANQVLRQLTYGNDSATAGSYVTLSVQASDAALTSAALAITLRINAVPHINTGVATGYSLDTATSETAYSATLPADLFSDADGDSLTWSVSGLPEGLSFDAATRTISGKATAIGPFTVTVTVTDASGATSAPLNLDLVVEQIANRAPEVNGDASTTLAHATEGSAYSVSLAGLFSDADSVYGDELSWTVIGLPEGLSFDAATLTLSGTASTVGDYSVTVTVTDEHGASAEHSLTLRVITQAEADNSAPVLSTEDINLTYTSEGDLTGFNQYVYSLELSSDDNTLLVVGSSSNGHSVTPSGNSTLYVYSRDSEGKLTLVQKFVQGTSNDGDDSNGIEIDGLASATSAVYSADGRYVYLVGKNSAGTYTVTTLQVGADGTLAATGLSVGIADSSTVRQMVVSDDGKALYVVSNSYLYAYSTADDGSLSLLGSYTDGISTSNALAIANGVVYVAGSSRVAIYTVNGDGSLTYATTWSGGSTFMRSIAATDSGYVYVSRGTSGIQVLHYDKDSHTATTVSSYATSSQFWGLTLSADGSALYAGLNGGTIYIFRVNADGTLTQSSTLGTNGAQGLRYAMSSDGSSIYYGSFYNGAGLGQISTSDPVLAYTEGGTVRPVTGVSLSDADYDALNNGAGDYNGATITIRREGGVNANDNFGFAAGGSLTLTGGKLYLDTTEIATFVNEGGALTIVFTGTVSTAIANEVLSRITYTNASTDPGASIRLSLTVQDQFKSGVAGITLALSVAEINNAPVVSTTPASLHHEPGRAAVGLFGDTAISTVESGQTIASLTLTVSGLADGAAETLTIDGKTVALVAGSGATEGGYAYTVTLSGDGKTATVVITRQGMTGTEAAALVDGLTYANAKESATAGERGFTLSVKDSGGTANGGTDTTVTASATVDVQFESPSLGATTGTLVDAGEISIEGVLDTASAGDLVYVVSAAEVYDDDTGEWVNLSTLSIYQRGPDGSLTLLHSVDSNTQSALADATEIRVSEDGATVYAIGTEGVTAFSYDAASGELALLGSFGADLGTIGDVLVSGDRAYVTSGGSLVVFTRTGDSWTAADTEAAPNVETQFTALTLSADGQYLYAGTSGGTTLVSVYTVASDGTLTFLVSMQGKDPAAEDQYYYASALAISSDGKTLYVADNGDASGALHVFAVADNGSLSAQSATALDGTVKNIILSQDGALLLLVGESKIGVYTRGGDGALALSATKTLGYSWASSVKGVTLSADGAQLYVAGSFSYSDTLLLFNLKPEVSTYTEGGSAVALLPGGTLSDPQLDAEKGGQGDYDGASITVERDGGASTDDSFTFIADDNLKLDGDVLKLDGEEIATFKVVDGKLTVTFTATVTTADAQNVLRRIAYANTSDDPTRDGSTASFTVTLNDGDGHSDTLAAEVGLVGVNDAPTITTSAVSSTYKAEGERVKLFENTSVRTVEAGQTVWQVIVTLEPAGTGDVLGVDGGKILLDAATSGVQSTGTGLQYMVSISGGKTTVTLFLNGTPERAAAVIDSLTYGNSGDALSGTRTIGLSVRDSGGTENGGSNLTAATATAVVTLASADSTNTAPALGGGAAASYTEQATAVAIAPGATVSDAQMDAFNGGLGNYDGAVLTVTLGEGKSAADTLGFTAENSLTLENGSLKKDGVTIGTVTNTSGVLTITFSDAAGTIPTTADVRNVLHQITYANSSDVPAASVAVSVTLADQRGLVSAALAFSIDITAVNDAPTVGLDPVLSLGDLEHLQDLDLSAIGLSTLSASVASADGSLVYVADDAGNIALFSRDADSGELSHVSTFTAVDGLAGIKQLQLSTDGKSLYALRADGNAIGVFGVDANGELTHQSTFVSDYAVDGNAFYDIRAIALSDDGETLYVINAYTLLYVSRDTATGALTYAGTLEGSMSSEPYLWAPSDVTVQGNLIFVTTSQYDGTSSLIVYQRGSNGEPVLLGYTDTGSEALDSLQHVAVSPNGGTVYVANGSRIDAFSLDVATGALTYLGALASGLNIQDIALTDDGKALFVTLADGTLNYYATANGALVGTQGGLDGATRIAVTADGGVIVLGDALAVLNAPPRETPAYVIGKTPVAFAADRTLADAELDAAADGEGNYKDAVISVTDSTGGGNFGFADGSGLTVSEGKLYLGGEAIATVANGGGTVTITFAAGVATDTANLVLRSLTYANDTAASGTTATLTIGFSDGASGNGTMQIGVSVLDVNDPPTLTATPATNAGYVEGGAATLLFSGATVSTVESGQLIAGLTLTVSGLKDGAGETLIIDGKTVALTDGASVTTESGLVVTVALDGATATVTIAAGDGISAAAAQTLVNGLGYANSGDNPTAGTRTVTLTAIKDDGGTENGGQDSTALAIAAAVTVVAVNDAPTLAATGGTTSYAASGAAAALFSGAAISTVESGQGILALTLSVSGVIDDGERLIVGGTAITLADGASVAIGNGLTVTVARDGSAATVTITAGSAISAEAAQALVDGLAYANAGSAVTFGERVVTLTAIRDDGGTAAGGADTTSGLSIEAHVTVVNSAPLAVEPVPALPSGTPGADYSVTLPVGMFRDADGEPLVWSVEGLPEGLSFDPETLTIGGATAVAGGHIVTVTVTDPHGASASLSLTLAIVAPTDTMAVTPALPMDDGSTGSMLLGNNQAVAPSAPVAADLAGRIGAGPFGTVPALAGLAQDPNLAFQSDGDPLFPAFPAATAGTGDPANPVPWGGDWIAEVEASGSGRDTVTILLPTRGMGEGVNLRLESGLPLPAWMRFDPRTGRLTVDAARLAQLQQIRLQMQVRTDDGTLRDATLEIRTRAAEPPTAGLTPPPRLPPPDGEKHAMAEPPADLLDEARALLAALAGLPSPQGASPAFEIHPHA